MNKLELLKSKIILLKDTDSLLNYWRFKNKKIVFTNGCFDIIHRGHIEYLAQAADYGDVLILGLNSDESIKRLKGNDRPIKDEYSRAIILAGLSFVSYIIIFETDTPYDLINFIKPDILAKGGDYEPKEIVGYDIVKNNGGKVVSIDFVEGQSSTNLICKMK